MLFAPFGTQSGAAMAAVPSDRHGQMMSEGHCEGLPDADQDDAMPDKSCCAAMCHAVAVAGDDPDLERGRTALPVISPATGRYRGILDEISTPPPRVS
jgi:hypothetical protein